jgi:hypothetical protein
VNKLAQAAGGSVDAPRSLLQEIEGDGVSEIGGYQVHRAYHDSMAGRALADVRLPAGTRVLLVQFGGSSLPAQVQTPVDRWAADGLDVATHVLADSETWWFAPDDSAEDRRPVTVEAVATTVEWVAASVDPPSVDAPSVGAPSAGAPSVGAPSVATPEVAR